MQAKTFTLIATLFGALGANAASLDEYALNQNLPAATTVTAPRAPARVAVVDEFQRNQLPVAALPTALQRAQVTAEAIEARKLGLVSEGERLAPVPSAAQAEQIRQAGLQAVHSHVAAR